MSAEREDKSAVAPEADQESVSSERKGSGYVRGERSGKWSAEEHMKYIAFIDFNRERMRSRDKRRSNKFYQEMADFVLTRNALQCRSHHQKLEEKYTHAPKIVNVFRHTFDRTHYRDALHALQATHRAATHERPQSELPTEIPRRSVETQTEISGLNLDFVSVGPGCYVIQPPASVQAPPAPVFYYNHFFLAHQPPTAQTLPSGEAAASPGWDNTSLHSLAGPS